MAKRCVGDEDDKTSVIFNVTTVDTNYKKDDKWQSLFLNKVADLTPNQKRDYGTSVFCEFYKNFKNNLLAEHLRAGRLLL